VLRGFVASRRMWVCVVPPSFTVILSREDGEGSQNCRHEPHASYSEILRYRSG
jgi:hypothetical protein